MLSCREREGRPPPPPLSLSLQLNINSHPNTKGKTSRNKKKKESTTTLKLNREKMEDLLELIHSEESQSGMQKAFQFFDSYIDSALKKFTETTSSGRKYEAYDLVRHGPRA